MPASSVGHRVSLVTTGLAVGGAETQVCLLAKGLSLRGWNVQVVSMLPPEAYSEELLEAGIPVYCLQMRRGVPDPRAIFRLARVLDAFRPHVAHCHMVHANLLGRITRLLARVPVVISTAHSIWEGPRQRDWAYKWTDWLCDLTTNVSLAGHDRYTSQGLSKAHKSAWVPNGIDVGRYTPDETARLSVRNELCWGTGFVWIAVGNLREPKDYPNLLRAFQLVLKVRPGCTLAIAGSGPLRAELESLANELNINRSVQFLGARSDVHRLLPSADAYVISSAWEGTPMALLEACASGLPAVATRVGGNPEILQHGKTGYLTDALQPPELAKGMLAVMALSDSQRSEMGKAGRCRVESIYGHARILSQWENIYEQLLQGKSVQDKSVRDKSMQAKLHTLPVRASKMWLARGRGSIWGRF